MVKYPAVRNLENLSSFETSRLEAYKRFDASFTEWNGSQPLLLDDQTMLRISMGKMAYIIHSLRQENGSVKYQGQADHFTRSGGAVAYHGDSLATVEPASFVEMLSGRNHYLNLVIGTQLHRCIPGAIKVESYPPAFEE